MNEQDNPLVGIKAYVLGESYISIHNENTHCTGCTFCNDDNSDRCDTARSYTKDECQNINFVKLGQIEVEAPKQRVKPPLGLMPLRTHNALRLNTVVEALDRYAQASLPAPKEWTTELADLILFERKYNQ